MLTRAGRERTRLWSQAWLEQPAPEVQPESGFGALSRGQVTQPPRDKGPLTGC